METLFVQFFIYAFLGGGMGFFPSFFVLVLFCVHLPLFLIQLMEKRCITLLQTVPFIHFLFSVQAKLMCARFCGQDLYYSLVNAQKLSVFFFNAYYMLLLLRLKCILEVHCINTLCWHCRCTPLMSYCMLMSSKVSSSFVNYIEWNQS